MRNRRKTTAIIISADEIKKSLPGYSPNIAEQFHNKSAKLADKEFEKQIRKSSYKNVILLNGGTASGKTEFILTQLANKKVIIFDGTMPTNKGAKIKIKAILKEGKNTSIYSVIPDNLRRAFIAFLNRDRKFSDAHFYRTHSLSRKTLLYIAQHYPFIKINIIESSYDRKNKLLFSRLDFEKPDDLIKHLVEIQLSEDDIIKLINIV
ncbi:hypothetical protein KBD45_04135 [Candidatus Dojkabacteria bacterium]|nr:hypothetical protein [Candidatus Dojkabacteria bacterium]